MESQLEEINEVRKDEQLVLPDNLDYMRYNISCCVSNSLGTFLPNNIIIKFFITVKSHYNNNEDCRIIEKFGII